MTKGTVFDMDTATDDELAAEIDQLAQAELAVKAEKRPLIAEAERRVVAVEAQRKFSGMSDAERAALRQILNPASAVAPD
jgi:hypothetical protein